MTKKTVIVIDDEKDARIILTEYLSAYDDIEVIKECKDGIEAIAAIDELQPDWIFLDIQMPGANGFEVLQRIRYIPKIIFSTAYDSFALEAFDHNAVDYLLKPYSQQRFSHSINKLKGEKDQNQIGLQRLSNSLQYSQPFQQQFMLFSGTRLINVNTTDILWIQANRDYVKVYTLERYYLGRLGISAFSKKLDPKIFIRIHRSTVININHLKEAVRDNIDSSLFLVLKNDKAFRVGRAYKDATRYLF